MTDLGRAPGNGPGVIIYDQGETPGTWIARLDGDIIRPATAHEIATQPIHHQWFSGTKNGLIATWPQLAHAQRHHNAYGVILGQIMPTTITRTHLGHRYAILVDHHGQPLTAGRAPT